MIDMGKFCLEIADMSDFGARNSNTYHQYEGNRQGAFITITSNHDRFKEAINNKGVTK
jgi:hypothetical protein